MITSERLPKGVSHLPMHIEDVKQTRKRATEHLSQGGREFATRSLVGERSRCFGKDGITQRVTATMLARPNDYCNFRGGWGLSLQTWVAPAGSIPAIADSLY